jgi:hypothetical protein
MTLKDLLFALLVRELLRAVEVALIRLKYGKKGDQAAFSGVRITIDGVRYEVRGVIERLD